MILADETAEELARLRECLQRTNHDLYQSTERARQQGGQIRLLSAYVCGLVRVLALMPQLAAPISFLMGQATNVVT